MLLIRTVESISMISSVIYAFQYLIFTSLSSKGESKSLSTSFTVLMVSVECVESLNLVSSSQSFDITPIL